MEGGVEGGVEGVRCGGSEVRREIGHRKRYEKAGKKEEAIDHKN